MIVNLDALAVNMSVIFYFLSTNNFPFPACHVAIQAMNGYKVNNKPLAISIVAFDYDTDSDDEEEGEPKHHRHAEEKVKKGNIQDDINAANRKTAAALRDALKGEVDLVVLFPPREEEPEDTRRHRPLRNRFVERRRPTSYSQSAQEPGRAGGRRSLPSIHRPSDDRSMPAPRVSFSSLALNDKPHLMRSESLPSMRGEPGERCPPMGRKHPSSSAKREPYPPQRPPSKGNNASEGCVLLIENISYDVWEHDLKAIILPLQWSLYCFYLVLENVSFSRYFNDFTDTCRVRSSLFPPQTNIGAFQTVLERFCIFNLSWKPKNLLVKVMHLHAICQGNVCKRDEEG